MKEKGINVKIHTLNIVLDVDADPFGPHVNDIIFCCLSAAADKSWFVALLMSNIDQLGLLLMLCFVV